MPRAFQAHSPAPDLTNLAVMLQTAANTLTEYCRSTAQPDNAKNHAEPYTENPKVKPDGKFQDSMHPGETRCFHVPPCALQDEEKLLEQNDTGNCVDLLGKVYDRLSTTVTLMEYIDSEAQLSGFTVQRIGEHLQDSLSMLDRVQSFLGEMRLVSVTTVK